MACCWLSTAGIAMVHTPLAADPVKVRHAEGVSHGFVLLRSEDGKTIASGDAIQTVNGARVTSELTLHFRDGSLYEEATIFEQRSTFRLVSDHLRQAGPSFPEPVDAFIDATGKVTLHTKDGNDKTYSLTIPDDAANGLLYTIIKNLPTLDSETSVSLVTTSSSPRVVKFRIRPSGTQTFTAGGPEREAVHLVGHTEIPGMAGALARVTGKQPADVDFWILQGKAPAFVRFRGPLYYQGPIWSIELTSPKLEDRSSASLSRPQHKGSGPIGGAVDSE